MCCVKYKTALRKKVSLIDLVLLKKTLSLLSNNKGINNGRKTE